MPKHSDSGAAEQAFEVFLCHNGADKPAVREIAERLRAANVEPWLDVEQLRPGFPWQRQLELQIRSIRAAAVFVGPSGIGPWQEEELDGFLREFQRRGCPVIPVLLPDCPTPPELPIFLGARTWVDFRITSPDPFEQLIWGITGRRPEQHRRAGRAMDRATPGGDRALAAWLRRVISDHRALAEYFEHTLLERVYVEVKLGDRSEAVEVGKMRGLAEPRALLEVLELDRAAPGHEWITGCWLLRGDPGSGKTTLLRRLAARLASHGGSPWVPVFDSLPKLIQGERSLPDRLAERLARSPGISRQQAADAFERWATGGRLLLLLDGLDEVPAQLRGEVRDVLDDLGEVWAGTPIVVTTRPIGGEVLEGFHRLELLPLDNANRRALLAGWFGRRTGLPETERAEHFANELEAHRELDELIGNPLSLTLMAMLAEANRPIEGRRSALYREILDLLIRSEHREAPADAISNPGAVRETLRQLAHEMTQEDVSAEPVAKLEQRLYSESFDRLRPALERCWGRQKLHLFLDDVWKRTWILGPHNGPRADWTYWHRTFREALAAERLLEIWEHGAETRLLECARAVSTSDAGRWAEPYALLAGRLAEPDALILALVEENRALGLRALATVQGLQRETIEKILEKLHEKQKDDEPLEDWEARARVYRRIPELLGEAIAALDLLERLRCDTSNGNDLFFLEQAMIEVGERWPAAVREVARRRARFFDHLGKPPAELFQRIVTPRDGEVELWAEIPAGSFLMGSPKNEKDRFDAENPSTRCGFLALSR